MAQIWHSFYNNEEDFDMLGRNSETYRQWVRELERYKNMPMSLNVANLGSTCDANNFDYKYWSVNGFNFASAPQDMYYDNQLLEQFGERFAKRSILFISLSEFAFLTDRYGTDYHNHKYYWYLEPSRIFGYSEEKDKLLKKSPGLLDNRYIKQEIKEKFRKIKSLIGHRENPSASLEAMSQKSMMSWMNEFGWDNDVALRDDQRETISRSLEILKRDIDFCKENRITPVIVIPPFCRYLKNILPEEILSECLWKYIDEIKAKGIKVVDFWHSDILEDNIYYQTPNKLNEAGKKVFNITLQKEMTGDGLKMTDTSSDERTTKDVFTLITGTRLPNLAFGTGVVKRFYRNKPMYAKDTIKAILVSIKRRKMVRFLKNDLTIKKKLENAVQVGYKLFDSGRLYGHSEKYIGQVLAKHDRNGLYIITKISDVDLTRYPNSKTVPDNLTISLKYLKTDYVDAYLLHFPSGDWLSMYKEIEREYENGRARAIGVCNFDVNELKELLSVAKIQPMICQVEIHPLNNKRELVSFCHEHGIVVMAHTPTGHMNKEIIGSKEFVSIMERHKKNAAQIIYRWHHQNGIIPIVSSTSKSHMLSNLDIEDFELTADEMNYIDSLDRGFSFDKNNNKVNDCPAFIYNI